MKKLICLIICIACILTMLVSCGEEETVCDAHLDADKNNACDTCGTPVYTVVEKVPTEEEVVDMIVSAIPEDATIGSIWAFGEDGKTPLGEFKEAENLANLKDASSSNFVRSDLLYYEYKTQIDGTNTTDENWTDDTDPFGYLKDDTFKITYVVYNATLDKNVYTYTTDEYTYDEAQSGNYDRIYGGIDVEADIFLCVEIMDYEFELYDESNPDDGYWTYNYVYEYYLANGTKLSSSADVAEGEVYNPPYDFSVNGDYAYVTVSDERHVYEIETCKLVDKGDKDTFLARPVFNFFMTDDYGYVMNNGKLFVYDLTKWIDCVFSYDMPSNGNVYVLANGNLFVQEETTLPSSAVNYDYVNAGSKFDIKYFVVDIAAKTETEVEFGYYVDMIAPAMDGENYAATVKNLAHVREIKNKNLGKQMTLACDDAMAILADFGRALPEFVNDVTVIAKDVYLGEVVYGEGSSIRKIFNAKGEELATVPNNATVRENYIECNGKYYDLTMKLLLDPVADADNPFILLAEYNEYLLFRQGNDEYYWNVKLPAPVMIAQHTNVPVVLPGEDPVELPNPVKEQELINMEDNYFVVRTTITTTVETPAADPADPPTIDTQITYEYKVYNVENKCILTSATALNINTLGEMVVAMDAENNIYVAK